METYFEYRIRGGDTLSAIISKMFGYAPGDSRYAGALAHIKALNPHIKNPNRIVSGELLRLGVIPQGNTIAKIAPKTQKPLLSSTLTTPSFMTANVAPEDIDNYWALSWLEENSNYLTIPGSIALGANGNLMSPGNIGLLKEVGNLYAEYKNGTITLVKEDGFWKVDGLYWLDTP